MHEKNPCFVCFVSKYVEQISKNAYVSCKYILSYLVTVIQAFPLTKTRKPYTFACQSSPPSSRERNLNSRERLQYRKSDCSIERGVCRKKREREEKDTLQECLWKKQESFYGSEISSLISSLAFGFVWHLHHLFDIVCIVSIIMMRIPYVRSLSHIASHMLLKFSAFHATTFTFLPLLLRLVLS